MSRFVAFLLLILLSPILLFVSIIILIEDGMPFFFIHERAGKNGVPFKMYKFRTMKKNTPVCASNRIKNPAKYLLKNGKWIRKTSIDEWPNLINVVKGEMTFIGPRPVLESEKKLLRLRHKYGIETQKPGITGYAQVNGRDNISLQRKLVLERYFLRHKNPWMKVKIIVKTLKIVLRASGIRF